MSDLSRRTVLQRVGSSTILRNYKILKLCTLKRNSRRLLELHYRYVFPDAQFVQKISKLKLQCIFCAIYMELPKLRFGDIKKHSLLYFSASVVIINAAWFIIAAESSKCSKLYFRNICGHVAYNSY